MGGRHFSLYFPTKSRYSVTKLPVVIMVHVCLLLSFLLYSVYFYRIWS
jgi:hypothetical protein